MKKKRILLVDDEESFTRAVKKSIEQTGEYVVEVENKGAEAASTAKAFKPDLIFLDVVMPDMEGRTVASEIAEVESLKSVSIVFLTATMLKEDIGTQAGLIAGHPCVAKPVDIKDLMNVIQRELQKK